MLPEISKSSASLVRLIDTLTEQLTSCIMDDDERAQTQSMKKTFIEKFIKENHHHVISTYTTCKAGKEYKTYTTRIPGGKKISAQSLDILKEKLYTFYSGKKAKEEATFASIFPEALERHTIQNKNGNKTKKRNKLLYKARIQGTSFDTMPIAGINTTDIDEFLRSLSNSVTRNELCNIKTLINFTFEYAQMNGIIEANIALSVSTKGIRVLPQKRVGELAYTLDEAKKIVEYTYWSKDVYYEAICFAFYAGIRYNEISDLKWSDWVTDELIIISHGNTESGNIKCGDKGVVKKCLPVEARLLLKRFKSERPDSEWIFPNKAGNRIFNNYYNEKLQKVCKNVGITYRSNHKIRAYVLTQMATNDDIESARKYAGHTNSRTTQGYINNGITDKDRRASDVLNLGIQTVSDQSQNK